MGTLIRPYGLSVLVNRLVLAFGFMVLTAACSDDGAKQRSAKVKASAEVNSSEEIFIFYAGNFAADEGNQGLALAPKVDAPVRVETPRAGDAVPVGKPDSVLPRGDLPADNLIVRNGPAGQASASPADSLSPPLGSRAVISPPATPRTVATLNEINGEFIARSEARPDIAAKLNGITELDPRAVTGDVGASPVNWKQIGTSKARIIRFDSATSSFVNMPGAAARKVSANAEGSVLPDANTDTSYYVFVTYKNANDQFITVGNYGGAQSGHPVVSGLYNIPGFEGFKPVLSGEFRVQNNTIVSVNNKSGRTNRYHAELMLDPEKLAQVRGFEKEALAGVFHVDPAVVKVDLQD